MAKYYYKVVGRDLCSCVVGQFFNRSRPSFCVQYKVGEFVKPKIPHTKLMIFETYRQAQNFSSSYNRIFKVEAKNVKRVGIFLDIWSTSFNKDISKMLKLKKQKKKYTHLMYQTIKGTLFASEIKLIREIEY